MVKRKKESLYIMINVSVHQEYLLIVNICVQHQSTDICKTKTILREEIKNTRVVGDFNSPHSKGVNISLLTENQ